MKAIIIALGLLMSLNVMATDRNVNEKTVTYVNEVGNNKECTVFDKTTSKPLNKTVYVKDDEGFRTATISCEWDDSKGWVNVSKSEYVYDNDGKVSCVTNTKWDNKKNEWSEKSEKSVMP